MAATAALSPDAVFAADPFIDREWSSAFGTPAIDHDVSCAVRWRGGLVVGGEFALAGVVPARNIAWWDGTDWRDLGGGLDGPVRCLAVVGDTLVVGGNFGHAGDIAAPGIARWTGERWITMGAGLTGENSGGVQALATYRGTLVAVGGFTQSGPAPMAGAAWWDGAEWHALGPGFEHGAGGLAAVYRDRLYVAGSFDGVEGAPAHGLAAWDGAHWSPVPWSAPPPYTSWNGIAALAAAHDRLYVGGLFDHADTVAADNLAAWDGNTWSGIAPITGYGVTALAVNVDTLVVATSYGGLWTWDGSHWIQPLSNLGYGYITSILTDGAGSVITGTIEASRRGTAESLGYGVLVSTGGDWSPLQAWSSAMHGFAPGSAVQVLSRYGTDIVAAGAFESVADGAHWARVDGLARWDGAAWNAFPGWPAGYGATYGMAAAGDTLILVGTFFDPVTGSYKIPGYRFDGAQWMQLDTLSAGPRSPTRYRGALYVGASPSMGNTLQAGGVYRLDGTHWTKVADISSPYNNPQVFTMVVHNDRLIVGGWFDHIDGVAVTNVAAWDGAAWTPYGELASGSSSPPVLGFAELDTTLYAVGSFGSANDAVVRWEGSAWHPMGPSGVASGIAAFAGQLHAAVRRTGTSSPDVELVRLDSTGWTTLATLNQFVLTLLPDGESLWLGGQFTTVDGVPSSRIARWGRPASSPGVTVALSPAVPNPSRGAVAFSYSLPTAGDVVLTVSDASGRHIATLDSGPHEAGEHSVQWDGRGEGGRRLPVGLYFVRLALPGGKGPGRKVVLLP